MFFLIPYGMSRLFMAYRSRIMRPVALSISFFALYTVLHIVNFGFCFFYREGGHISQYTATVSENEVLSGIKMTKEKAICMKELSIFVVENELKGKEALFYYYIPSLSYYLQMPPVYTSWPELNSKSAEELAKRLYSYASEQEYPPVVIGRGCDLSSNSEKTKTIREWIEGNGYELAFQNEICDIYLKQ